MTTWIRFELYLEILLLRGTNCYPYMFAEGCHLSFQQSEKSTASKVNFCPSDGNRYHTVYGSFITQHFTALYNCETCPLQHFFPLIAPLTGPGPTLVRCIITCNCPTRKERKNNVHTGLAFKRPRQAGRDGSSI